MDMQSICNKHKDIIRAIEMSLSAHTMINDKGGREIYVSALKLVHAA